MEFPVSFKVTQEEETIDIAKKFSAVLQEGDIVTLNGNLGAGKTFFVKAVCKFFGIENSSSPSFAIVNQYDGNFKIYHFDFYRIKKENELFDLGFEDYVNDLGAICFIEWSDMFPEVLPTNRFEINLNLNEDNSRDIRIIKNER